MQIRSILKVPQLFQRFKNLLGTLNVNGIKLSEDVHQILLDPQGWLTDEHIDAGQDLFRMMGTGVRGLNSVVAMTHFSKLTVATKSYQAIQCQNVGNH